MKRWAFGSIAFFATLFVLTAVPTSDHHTADAQTVPASNFNAAPVNVQLVEAPAEAVSEELEERSEEVQKPLLPFKLLETSEGFHSDEVEAETGDVWLGLFKNGNRFYLRKSKLTVTLVNDPIVDNEKEKTGKSVATDSKHAAVFLLKNADELLEKEIATVFAASDSEESDLINGSVKLFSFNGQQYRLEVVHKEITAAGKPLEKGSELVLTNGNKRQVLRTLRYCDDCSWSLEWVGDLVRDGKLDFYFQLNQHYNALDKRLFLSSKAQEDRIVEYVANFVIVGC